MFAVVDVETTGGSPAKDRITEIAILIHNGKRVIENYTTLVNPQRPIDPFVMALTGISDEMVADAPTFDKVAEQVNELTEGRIIVGHNVRFDYGMFRQEFRRLGKNYTRKQLCTVKLSQKVFPGLPSYSLGRLCKSLEIHVDNRHRAFGDAAATAVLLEKLILNDRKELISLELKEGIDDSKLPKNIHRKMLEELPEDTGVYYFLDDKDKILYIGKSKDIKKRVISHMSRDIQEEGAREMLEKVCKIDYRLTGNELIAMLLESDEIKRFMPPYNKAQRRKNYRYGIFEQYDDEGFKLLKIAILNDKQEPVIKCTTRRIAERVLERLLYENNLVAHVPMLTRYKKMSNASYFKEIWNEKVEKALSTYYYKHSNFLIIGEGIRPDENSVVCVENHEYKGFGYFSPEFSGDSVEAIKDHVEFYRDNPDVNRIIRGWLRKKNKYRLITY